MIGNLGKDGGRIRKGNIVSLTKRGEEMEKGQGKCFFSVAPHLRREEGSQKSDQDNNNNY